ncbi:unnamed protein product [Penicillium pancosmium]
MHAKNITFEPSNMYSRKARIHKKVGIIKLVIKKAPASAVSATVVNGWHTSSSDGRLHCTVNFDDASENLISREHIV